MNVPQHQDTDGNWRPTWPADVVRTHRVYFIRNGEHIKVGFSTDVAERFKQLQTASPHPLVLLKTIVGTTQLEAEIHKRLKEYGFHARGEWFTISDDQVHWIIDDLFRDGLVSE